MKTKSIVFMISCGIFFLPIFVCAQEIKNGVLARSEDGYKVYFIENGIKRWIKSAEIFDAFGFDWNKIKVFKKSVLANYPEGRNLEDHRYYPEGMLFKVVGDLKIYTVENGRKKWIEDENTFNNLDLDWSSVVELPVKNVENFLESYSIKKSDKIVKPIISLVIVKFPEKTLEDNIAEFEFNAKFYKSKTNDFVFETFLEGVDKEWQSVYGNSRKIILPKKNGNYVFFVRVNMKDIKIFSDSQKYDFNVILSPDFGDLSMQGSNVLTSDPDLESVVIANTSKDDIIMSGWSVEDKKHKTRYTLGDAYEIPVLPGVYKSAISLPPDGKIVIYSGKSPLGSDFSLNKCAGYLNNNQDFQKQSLPNYCPAIQSYANEIDSLEDYCNRIISNTQRCSEPDYNNILLSNDCREYLRENFGYVKCVEKHKDDKDFFSNEWRMYLNAQKDLWDNKKGTIILRDQNGFAVSSYTY